MRTPRRHEIEGLDRAIAVALAAVWSCAGVTGAVLGIGARSWLLVACSLFAVAYGLAWVRVAVRGRLLSWRELVMPWRAR